MDINIMARSQRRIENETAELRKEIRHLVQLSNANSERLERIEEAFGRLGAEAEAVVEPAKPKPRTTRKRTAKKGN